MMKRELKYEILEKLGEGAYGDVYKVRLKGSCEFIALKSIKMSEEDEGITSNSIRQITILKSMDHPNVVRLLNYEVSGLSSNIKLDMYFEFLEQDLAKHTKKNRQISIKSVQSIMKQLLSGVCYLHQKFIFHRDLKPQNILIDQKGNVKIADFGLARIIQIDCPELSKEIQTLWYRAPQLLFGFQKYNFAVDVWSIGCIFFQLAERKVLFQTESEIGQIMEIMKQLGTPKYEEWEELKYLPNFKPTFPKFKGEKRQYKNLSLLAIDLLEKMIKIIPRDRISVEEALQHPFFNEKFD